VARARPVVAFFGPTSDAEIDLYGRGEKIVTRLDCRCCYLSDCPVRPHCMQSLSVQDLADAVDRWLTGLSQTDLDRAPLLEIDPSSVMTPIGS
jgi:hypothetical protein